jgi:hypothetical protein
MNEWVLDPLVADLRERHPYQAAGFDSDMRNLNGVSWFDAPAPFWVHRCKAQTVGWVGFFTSVERCACGSVRLDGRRWMERNARRRGR